MIWFFLLSGLFLGWSLGANDAANIFGTAVGTRMIKFKTAALIGSIFVILGAVFSGTGTTQTLEQLGAVNALGGSFTVALGAALSVTIMTRFKLPVSTSQSIVGGIVGWNYFTGFPTNYQTLVEIVVTWLTSFLLAGFLAVFLFLMTRKLINKLKLHLLKLDYLIRNGLIIIGAFGAYSLGANNIANVVGVFVPASPFQELSVNGWLTLSGAQQLFLIGAMSICIGIYTYSHKVMRTVGSELYKLTPVTALIVVLSVSLVLFVFASQSFRSLLIHLHFPAIPLVPISSSQAVIGAVIGIGTAKGGKGINYGILGKISLAWLITPAVSCLLTIILLFFAKNVFELTILA